MNGKMQKVKGKIKEAAGKAVKSPELKRSGRRDQAVGEAKEQVAKTIRLVRRSEKKATKRVNRAIDAATGDE